MLSHDVLFLATDVLLEQDELIEPPEMAKAKIKEIKAPLDRGTLKIILREKMPHGKLLPDIFRLSIKSSVDGKKEV